MKRLQSDPEDLAVCNDYVGLVATEAGNRNKFLVDKVNILDGIVSIEGPAIKRDGTLAKTVRIGTYPQYCNFTDWHPFSIPEQVA